MSDCNKHNNGNQGKKWLTDMSTLCRWQFRKNSNGSPSEVVTKGFFPLKFKKLGQIRLSNMFSKPIYHACADSI